MMKIFANSEIVTNFCNEMIISEFIEKLLK